MSEKKMLSGEELKLLRRTICKDLSDDDFAIFVRACEKTGLDPFARQIHPVIRTANGVPKMTIQAGIDGLRLIAERTGEADGMDGPYWCGDDGVWTDCWLGSQYPAAAKVVIYRKGQTRGYPGIAHWREYAPVDRSGNLIGLWQKLRATMLAKCAEALARRQAFPQETNGLYIHEEMHQAGGGPGVDVPGIDNVPDPAPRPAPRSVPQPATQLEPEPAPSHDEEPPDAERVKQYEDELMNCDTMDQYTAVAEKIKKSPALTPGGKKYIAEVAAMVKANIAKPKAKKASDDDIPF